MNFSDITPELINDYRHYLLQQRRNNRNTVERSVRVIKTWMNAAYKHGYIARNNIACVTTKRLTGKRDFLTKEQLLELHRKIFSLNNQRLKNVGIIFLFACYTGLRYSDVKQLCYRHIQGNAIRLQMIKTSQDIFIPLNRRAQEILKFAENQSLNREGLSKIFRVLSNQKINQYLKEIAKVTGIDKHLTFHVARHTFATVSIELGIPIEVVSKLLGHSDLKTTMIYTRILDPVKIREMQKWDF